MALDVSVLHVKRRVEGKAISARDRKVICDVKEEKCSLQKHFGWLSVKKSVLIRSVERCRDVRLKLDKNIWMK